MTRTHIVSATVVSEDAHDILNAAEKLQRVAVGLSLEGITVRMDFSSFEVEDDEDEEASTSPDPAGDRETPEA